MSKNALITGITGQDGSYLAELLLDKGYHVHGIMRRSSSFNTGRIDHIFNHERLTLHFGDMTDESSLRRALEACNPDEIYNLAAQSHVKVSFEMPVYTADTVFLGTLRLLEAARAVCPNARLYQASSSEMFGNQPAPQSESTPFAPESPYATAKVAAHQAAVHYRKAYGMHVSCGILFNHESPRRGETFVTRKVCKAAARIKLGIQEKLHLGNLDARRDWGFAGDCVRAMWAMLQQDKPGDFVIGTGISHSVRELLDTAFRCVDMLWDPFVETDPRYRRPSEVIHLCADPTHAQEALGWFPSTGFSELIRMMVDAELEAAGG